MRGNNGYRFPAVGVVSLIVIFSVLCLTVFAMLTISSVKADEILSSRTAATVEGYYRADYKAEQTLAQLRSGEIPENVTETKGVFYYTYPISDTQNLAVEVMVDGSDYNILRWQAVSTANWIAEDELPVWDGVTEEEK